jgi:hypothetical protein
MIQKPAGSLGKSVELAESYKPISLSKLFEKLLLPRFSIIMESHGLISDHQFGFRGRHA